MSNNGNLHICSICGRACKTGGALTTHLRTCRKRPPREVLAADCEAGTTNELLAHQYRVSEHTMRQWLTDYDLVPAGKPPMEVYPGYAPKLDLQYHECARCNALPVCRFTVREFGWVLCESPDAGQIAAWLRKGFDILQFTTELWAVHPEIWQ